MHGKQLGWCGFALASIAALVIYGCSQVVTAGGGGMPPGFAAALDAPGLPACRPGSDELWIFSEAPRAGLPAVADGPRSGQMVGRDAAGALLPMPLQHTDVHASVRSFLSVVDVTQRFANPYEQKIEAVYVFPLPDDAAVRDFVMQIGERQIRGIVRKRDEARAIYLEARQQGYRASLLEQARPNVFEQSVANLEPGAAIDVKLRYFHTLAYGSDGYEFVFPMVVGPRYNPPGWSDGVGAVTVDGGGDAHQPVVVPYSPDAVTPPNRVAVQVDLDAGLALADVQSPSHAIDVERRGATGATVRLTGGETVPDRDFVLRFRPGGEGNRACLFTGSDATGGYLTMLVQPPDALRDLPRQPLELVFLLDVSGSMQGTPLRQATAAIEMALGQLDAKDRFEIVCFANGTHAFAGRLVPVDAENVAQARSFLRSVDGRGGTEMLAGIRAALAIPAAPTHRRFVCFLTDGFIGNEVQIFDAVREELGAARVFSLGVGSSVNRFLLEGVARLGRGAVGYLLHDEPPGRAVAQLFEGIAHPALTDVVIDWGGADVRDVFPAQLPDLYAGRPVVVTARYAGEPPRTVQLRGKVGGGAARFDAVACADGGEAATALPALWARRKIQALSDYAGLRGAEVSRGEVEQLALGYGLMSAYTSFVAVDASQRTAGDHGTTLTVPVPMPAGVRYESVGGSR